MFSISGLPPGLLAIGATISGTPTSSGTFSVTIRAIDSSVTAQTVSINCVIVVNARISGSKREEHAPINQSTDAPQRARLHRHGSHKPATQDDILGFSLERRPLTPPEARSQTSTRRTNLAVPVAVFCAYSHKDEKLRDKLESHLSQIKRDGLIDTWYDRKITPGSHWKGEIDLRLNASRLVLLLISADFISSDYCYDVELKCALKLHQMGEARVIPIILRPVDWHSAPFAKLQCLPKDARAITDWSNRDRAFAEIAKGIRKVVEELSGRRG